MNSPATASAHWSLLMKAQPGSTPQFFEIRRCGRQIWSATGAVQTFGEDKVDQFESDKAAVSAHRRIIEDQVAAGFRPVRDAPYDARVFDYAGFIAEVRDGVREAYESMRALHPTMNALALITDHDAMTICLFASATSRLHYNPWEWSIDYNGGALDIAYRMILSKVRDIPFEWRDGVSPGMRKDKLYHGADDGALHRDGIYECFIRALEDLRRERLFGEPGKVLVLVGISDNQQIAGMAGRLNGPVSAARFALATLTGSFKLRPPKF